MLGKIYEKHHLAVHILQYSLDKKFIKDWPCIKLAEDTLKCSIVPNGITSGGYFWVYDNSEKEQKLEEKYLKYINLPTKYMGKSRVVYCFDLFGELVESYNSCSEAAYFNNCTSSEISHAALSKQNGNIVHNYIWIYEDDL